MIQIVTTPKHVAFVQWFFFKTFWREFNIVDFGKKKFFFFEKLKIYFETEEGFLKKKKWVI